MYCLCLLDSYDAPPVFIGSYEECVRNCRLWSDFGYYTAVWPFKGDDK